MSLTTTPTHAVASPLNLASGTVLEGEERQDDAVTGRGYGIYRAIKSPLLIEECVALLNRGGVVALVPASASRAYLEMITEQVIPFARSRSRAEDGTRGGILALPTSGSTGAPKLVALPVACLERFLGWGRAYFGLKDTTVSLSLSPWNFDVSLLDTWAVLAAGGTVVAAGASRLHDTSYVARLLEQYCPTFIQVVPSTLDALVAAVGEEVYPSVQHVVVTGGVVAPTLRGVAASLFPEATFHNVYGSTEVNDCLIETLSARQFACTETLPIGTSIAGCEVLLDGGGLRVPVETAAEGVVGELLVRTPWMALGYIAEGVIKPLSLTKESLLPMGDLALRSRGRLMYQGRRDRTIKLRGQRVNLEEIEHAARQSGLVGLACAWLDTSGSTEELHLAYTAPESGAVASGLQLRVALSARLPSFAMPNRLHAFAAPFPVNGNGKPDLPTIKSRAESE